MQDGPPRDYSERLWPGVWLWLVAAGMVGMLAVAYGAALSAGIGWLIGGIAGGALLLLVWRWTPRLTVGADGLGAGRATLPWQCVGRVVELDGEGARVARGPRGDASAFTVTRPGVGPGAVVVEVVDPEDPHRTWLLATRDPRGLACAIEQARGRLRA